MKAEDRGDADPSLPILVVRSSDGAKLPNDVVRSMELMRLSLASPPACRAATCARCRRMCLADNTNHELSATEARLWGTKSSEIKSPPGNPLQIAPARCSTA